MKDIDGMSHQSSDATCALESEDRSKGVHNTQYTYDVLNASIEALE